MKISDIRKRYCMDAVGAEVVNPNYGMKTNVENRLSLKRRGNGKVMTISQYGKPARVSLKNVGGKFVIFNSNGEKLSKPFDSQKEAEDFARKGNWIITGRISKDSVSVNDAVSIRRVANADPEDSHITVKFKDGKLNDYAFKSVKAAMDYIKQGNYSGAVVIGFPSRKVLAK